MDRTANGGSPKPGASAEIPYGWIQLTTGGIFEALKKVENTKRNAFARWDFAESTQKHAFERLKEGGRVLAHGHFAEWRVRTGKIKSARMEN